MNRIISIVLTLFILGVLGYALYHHYLSPSASAPAENTLPYTNAANGYSVAYPNTLEVKEYMPDQVVFGHITNQTVEGVAEARVMVIEGRYQETFQQTLANELEKLCAADGPNGSFYCDSIQSAQPFITTADTQGLLLYLAGHQKSSNGSVTDVVKGPYFAITLKSGTTASKVLVIQAPLNKSAAEADISVIQSIAKSVVLTNQ